MKRFFVLLIALGLVAGCTHVVSRAVLKQVDTRITFDALLKDPNAYAGKTVLLGGVIVDTVNKQEGTLLEIYDTALDREGEPVHIDRSQGRFLALYDGFLDSEIYKKGRKVTIAGTVVGKRAQQVGEIQYRYPYLLVKEIHLWKREQPVQYAPYPYYGMWWYDPWYPWGPWWYPWGPGVVVIPDHAHHHHH
jgi:outer membrane lipoprotein